MNQWCKGERFSVSIGRPSYPWYWFSHLASFHLLPEWIGVSAMPHDCREPIQDVVHLFTFDVDLSAAYVEADNWLLLKFILNIVMDAVKYSDSKTQICIRSYKDDDRTIAIEVENLGWGISEEDLKPVEQSFYQAIPERSELGGIGWAYRLLLDTSCTEDPFRYTVNWDRAPRRELFFRRWSWKVKCLSPGMGTDYFGWFAGSSAFASANPLARRRHESQMPQGTSWLS